MLAPLKRFMLALLIAAGGVYPARSAAVPAPLRIEGREYIAVAEWARANDFQSRWVERDKSLQLLHNSSKLLLTLDSREAQVNGVQVWLSFPPLARNGLIYIAQLDVQTTLRPLLLSTAASSGHSLRSICLDPGHGGKDPGFCIGKIQEKKYTLQLAKELRDQLVRSGFKVTLTRTGDKFVELPSRPEMARQRKADLFISLHFNAAEVAENTVQGTQVFCLTPPGAASTNARGESGAAGWVAANRNNEGNVTLAYQLQRALTHRLAIEDRGVRRARFVVLREAAMPAVLVEAGFMSHPVEGRKIATPAYQRQLAQAITEGVLAFKRATTSGA